METVKTDNGSIEVERIRRAQLIIDLIETCPERIIAADNDEPAGTTIDKMLKNPTDLGVVACFSDFILWWDWTADGKVYSCRLGGLV
jgi:hypothetical protein